MYTFQKEFWKAINDGGRDDEHMMHQYCKKNKLQIFCQRSIPFAHMAYFVQREENRDIVEAAQKYIKTGFLCLILLAFAKHANWK